MLASNTVLARFRVVASVCAAPQNRLSLSRAAMRLLECTPGDAVRSVALHNEAAA
jgi:arginine/ornithine N-succinyltransferase beta subunit